MEVRLQLGDKTKVFQVETQNGLAAVVERMKKNGWSVSKDERVDDYKNALLARTARLEKQKRLSREFLFGKLTPKTTLRILFVYDQKNWAYYRRCEALLRNAPDDIQCVMTDIWTAMHHLKAGNEYDLIFNLVWQQACQIRKYAGDDALIIGAYNSGSVKDKERFALQVEEVQLIIVNSELGMRFFPDTKNVIRLSNAVDLDSFYVEQDIASRPTRVLWTGSTIQKETKNFANIVEPLEKSLKAAGIEFDVFLVDSSRPAMNTRQMRAWYNTGTIYLVASSSEGTPNPALEAAACGCTIVSTRVGNMPELIEQGENGILCETSLDSIRDGVLSAVENQHSLALAMQKSILPWGWAEQSKAYFRLFHQLIERKDKEHAGVLLQG